MSGSVLVLVISEFPLSPELEADWLERLPTDRRATLRRWPDSRERQRSLLGSRLLHAGLMRLGCADTALATLRHRPRSRPTLDEAVHFSVSHCEGRIVCALSQQSEIGVDVEALGGLEAKDFPRYLNARERAWAGASARRFYSVWTRKEAVAKAAGSRGLAAVPDIDTTLGERRAAYAGRHWRTMAIPVGRRHVAHLALADASTTVTVERVPRRAVASPRSNHPPKP